jgi:hypothetical protein
VERGRELRADYKLIARALTRKGNALAKQGRLEEAVGAYQKSLTEHRCLPEGGGAASIARLEGGGGFDCLQVWVCEWVLLSRMGQRVGLRNGMVSKCWYHG